MTERLGIALRDDGPVRIVALEGRADALGAPGLEAAILGSVREGRTRIVVDCSRLTYLSSSGLRALLAGLKAARRTGGGCALAALADEPKRVIVTTGFDRLFLLGDDIPDAAARLLSPVGGT
ncbi:MAG: STAS domain-containing protein [Methanoregulaceae archaeon]